MKIPIMRQPISTVAVLLTSCFLVGQITLLSSLFTSLKNLAIFARIRVAFVILASSFMSVFPVCSLYIASGHHAPACSITSFPPGKLFGFLMGSMFVAEFAIFVHLYPVRIILLIFHCSIVALLALAASHCNLDPHRCKPPGIPMRLP